MGVPPLGFAVGRQGEVKGAHIAFSFNMDRDLVAARHLIVDFDPPVLRLCRTCSIGLGSYRR